MASLESTLPAIIGLVVIIALISAYILLEIHMIRKKRIPFQERPDMSEEQFYLTYYKNSDIPKETVIKLLKLIASAIEIPVTKIRPSDRFDKELAPQPGWEFDDGLAEVIWLIKREQKKAGVSETIQLNTVNDLIQYVHSLEKQKDG